MQSYKKNCIFANSKKTTMKKLFVLFFSIFILSSLSAQRFIGGVVGGMNLTQVEGDEVNGYYKAGFNGGGMVMLPLNHNQTFFITTELLFNQKGAFKSNTTWVDARPLDDTLLINYDIPKNNKVYYKLRLDYVEVPILFHYEDPHTGFALGIGASWARLVNIKETFLGYQLHTDLNSGRYYKNTWNFILDVKIPVYQALKINFRYQYSIAPIGADRTFYTLVNADPYQRRLFHNVLSFRVLYTFNDKYYLNNSYKKDGSRNGPKWIRDNSQ